MKLPETYREQMRSLLGDEEWAAYEAAMKEPYAKALRVNTLKVTPERLRKQMEDENLGDSVPWCPLGIYLKEESAALSHHPFYAAGLYYLQEPSAMAPASFLPIEPGDRVLDLCAAPGGKSTALGAKLAGTGLLVANDISPSRAKALLRNLETFGVTNGIVVSEAPYKLAERFSGFFNKVLVDAPCSGEGMFRKDPSIAKNWLQYGNAYYAKLQREILPEAAKMVAPGGMLLYSTCTYAPLEDEQTVADFLQAHPDFHLEALPKPEGVADGVPAWAEPALPELVGCARFWPHRLRGEGHFVALFRREGNSAQVPISWSAGKGCAPWEQWAAENLRRPYREILPAGSQIHVSGDKVYAMLLDPARLHGLRVLRPGLLLGETRYNRLEPSQALAMVLRREWAGKAVSLLQEEAHRYLRGETLLGTFAPGWNLICVGEYPLGWGKATGDILKNKYLKSWRVLK